LGRHCHAGLLRRVLALTALATSLVVLGAPLPAQAQAPLVLAFDDLLPWKTHSGELYGGAYTEIVRELAQRVGLPLLIKPCPLKRCLTMLQHGDADIIIGVKDTPERQRYLQFLHTPYRTSSADKVFFVLKENGARITHYDDLRPLRIGVKLGADYFTRFDQDMALKKDTSKDMDVNFRKLAMGRIDAVIAAEDQGEAMLAQLKLGDRISKAPWRVADPSARSIAISRHSKHIASLAAFEKAMAAMAKDGTLAALYRRHYYEAYHVPLDSVQIR
jgi:polar amino acid transport system substrate-binding protein